MFRLNQNSLFSLCAHFCFLNIVRFSYQGSLRSLLCSRITAMSKFQVVQHVVSFRRQCGRHLKSFKGFNLFFSSSLVCPSPEFFPLYRWLSNSSPLPRGKQTTSSSQSQHLEVQSRPGFPDPELQPPLNIDSGITHYAQSIGPPNPYAQLISLEP